MKRTTLPRRLLAGAAALAVGLGGILAAATPAQATGTKGPRVTEHNVSDCDGLKIKLWPYAPRSGNSFRVLDANGDLVWPEGVDVSEYGPDNLAAGWVSHGSYKSLWLGPDTAFPVEVSYWSPSNPGGPGWRSEPYAGVDWPVSVDWEPAPGKWPRCGDSPAVRIIEDCDGNVTVTIDAGDTRRTWRVDGVEKFLDVDESETFPATSPEVIVEWWHAKSEAWKPADESYVLHVKPETCPDPEPSTSPEPEPSTSPEPEGGDDETPGPDNGEGGGRLPETGTQVALVAGGALMLLALGGAMYVVARRRRITFSA